MVRISKEQFYFNVAKTISERSTCLHAHVGAILVKNDMIISQGYNGSARGEENCCDIGTCSRPESIYIVGTPNNYELCKSIHAEMNTIINAARHNGGTIGATMFVYYNRIDGRDVHGHVCNMCTFAIKNAGIIEVLLQEGI